MTERIVSDDVDNLVRAIRTHADRKAINRELYAGLNRAVKPLKGSMIDAIREGALPRGGGLAEEFAAKVSARASAKSGKWAGVSLRFSARGYDIRTLTQGRIRHPLYGNRGHWFEQTAGTDPEVFTGEFDDARPRVEREITAVLEGIARKITGGI